VSTFSKPTTVTSQSQFVEYLECMVSKPVREIVDVFELFLQNECPSDSVNYGSSLYSQIGTKYCMEMKRIFISQLKQTPCFLNTCDHRSIFSFSISITLFLDFTVHRSPYLEQDLYFQLESLKLKWSTNYLRNPTTDDYVLADDPYSLESNSKSLNWTFKISMYNFEPW